MFSGRKIKQYVLPLAAILLWMMVIFLFSAETSEQSSAASEGITQKVINIFELIKEEELPESDAQTIEKIIRKTAHFTIYFVLAVLLCCFIKQCNVKNICITVLCIALLYAVSDEFHQSFVPGRSMEVKDVFIDFTGILTGTLFYLIKKEKKEM